MFECSLIVFQIEVTLPNKIVDFIELVLYLICAVDRFNQKVDSFFGAPSFVLIPSDIIKEIVFMDDTIICI